ncbi:Panacea domain-containing protein [Azospirillum himalayense]|uniref:Panacea domain-containing protein n=1 Tax=Azospirillum himalayense TaxID=654847 RepID=A0ABW0GE53_9PROT
MTDMIRAATDRLIQLSYEAGKPLSPLPLQKLLYFVEGWHLAITGAPLFDEEFQAWANGPALPSVYRRMKHFGQGDIPDSIVDTQPEHVLAPRVIDLIEQVYRTYGGMEPGTLVGMTHIPGAPWEQVRSEANVPRLRYCDDHIDAERMQAWFRAVMDEGLQPDNQEVIDASPEEIRAWAHA